MRIERTHKCASTDTLSHIVWVSEFSQREQTLESRYSLRSNISFLPIDSWQPSLSLSCTNTKHRTLYLQQTSYTYLIVYQIHGRISERCVREIVARPSSERMFSSNFKWLQWCYCFSELGHTVTPCMKFYQQVVYVITVRLQVITVGVGNNSAGECDNSWCR